MQNFFGPAGVRIHPSFILVDVEVETKYLHLSCLVI